MPADPRVKELFAAAAALPDPDERRRLLDDACAGDADLRARLDALLRAHDHPASALERPMALAPTDAHPSGREAVGAVVAGRYKLLERIGEGGMGEVWVAEQLEPVRRRVALKMIKPGMDSRSVLGRFEAERQALAMMDHPHIAKVFDAGTTDDGRPFFVMELVKGTPITAFADARKLSPRERLELFVPVCQAIQHAHQKGVIHRDIKPTNVLVELHDDRAVPKVIDFGVAKAVGQQLTEKTVYTGFGALVGTPAYMAPEQATFNALDVDTRADVYSLGVLLYELLAGSPPFEPERLKKAALDEVLRLVREEEPPRPSTRLSTSEAKATIAATRRTDPAGLARLIRGELDWVVMKALDKDRTRRYDSATGLAKDVERYLAGDAVEACPPTLGYRLRKYGRRNRAALVTALLFTLVLVVTTVFSVYQASRAFVAESRAEQRLDDALVNRAAADDARKEADRERDETKAALGKLRIAQEQQQADQYVWDLQLLPLAFEAGNVGEVNRLLDRHAPQAGRPDRRGFEWHYWQRQLHTDLRTDRLHDVGDGHGFWTAQGVWATSPDGSRVARLAPPADAPQGNALVLHVWDVAARKLVRTHRLPSPNPPNDTFGTTAAVPQFSPDGKRVLAGWTLSAVVSGGGAAWSPGHRQVLDVDTGRVLLDLEGDRPLADLHGDACAFSPDGRRFAAVLGAPGTGRGRVHAWDLGTGQEVGTPADGDSLAGSAFSPDGARLVSARLARVAGGAGMRVSVRGLARGDEVAGWDVPPSAKLHALTCSPDGARVAGVTGERPAGRAARFASHVEPQTVTIWEAATGEVLHTLPLPRPAGAGTTEARLFFSPDGTRLAVGRVPALARSGSGGSDLTLWDATTGKPLPPLAGFADTSAAGRTDGPAFSPDGRLVVATDGNVLRAWDVGTGRLLRTLRGHANPVGLRGFTADGKRLWSLELSGLLKEWDARPSGPVAIPVAGPLDSLRLGEFAVSADGSRAATLDEARTGQTVTFAVRVWEAAGKSVKLLVPPPRDAAKTARDLDRVAHRIALSRDGRRALLLRTEITAKAGEAKAPPDFTVWDVDTGAVLLHQLLDGLARPSAALSPDGSSVASVAWSVEGDAVPTIRVFDVADRRERRSIPVMGAKAVTGLTFSPDGRRLATLVAPGEAAKPIGWDTGTALLVVWDAETGEQVSAAPAGPGRRFAIDFPARMAWSHDGARYVLSSGSLELPRVVVHETATGRPLATMDQPLAGVGSAEAACVALSPDGRRVAAFLTSRRLGPPVVKVWDAASGKELLALRPTSPGGWATKRLTFSADGARLVFAEFEADTEGALGGSVSRGVTRPLLLTTWDGTPRPEGKQP